MYSIASLLNGGVDKFSSQRGPTSPLQMFTRVLVYVRIHY